MANRLTAEERRDRVMELHLAGATIRQTRELLAREGIKVGIATISRDIQRRLADHIEATRHQTETWRTRQNMRIERLLRDWWPRALSRPKVDAQGRTVLDAAGRPVMVPGDQAAFMNVMVLLNRQARLLGLDAPQQVAVAAKQIVEVKYQHIQTLQQNGAAPEVEGTPEDPRITMPEDAPTYEETGWLGDNGRSSQLALVNGEGDAEDAEVVD